MALDIELRKFKDINLEDGIIVECLPSVSMLGGIVGSHIVSELDLDQVFAFESERFPPISMVFSTKPKFPIRGYASSEHKIVVILSEFIPSPNLSRPLAYKLLNCYEEFKCSKIISFEGLPVIEEENTDRKLMVFGLGSTDSARKLLEDSKISQMDTGMVVGVTAILMNEGRWRNRDVISLMGEIRENISPMRTAVGLLEAFNKLFPQFNIKTKALLEQAKEIETHFEKLQTQANPVIREAPMNIYG